MEQDEHECLEQSVICLPHRVWCGINLYFFSVKGETQTIQAVHRKSFVRTEFVPPMFPCRTQPLAPDVLTWPPGGHTAKEVASQADPVCFAQGKISPADTLAPLALPSRMA